jgi:DMSO/TMAO reductase YedYZ molybdopterin-dependent catalytic subunit
LSASTEPRVTALSRRRRALGVIAAWVVLPALGEDMGKGREIATALAVRGNVATPLSLTVADLRKFPAQRVDDTRVVRGEGGSGGTARQFAGCLLRDVLLAARLTERDRLDLRKTIVVATASDGYKAVFSWGELFNTTIGDGVLIVYERDGAPLGNDEGPIALVSLKDTRPGPRHVKWLVAVEAVRVSD